MKLKNKIITLALGILTSFGALASAGIIGKQVINNSAKAATAEEVYNVQAKYWDSTPSDNAFSEYSRCDEDSALLEWSNTPSTSTFPAVEVASKESFHKLEAVYLRFAVKFYVPAYTERTVSLGWRIDMKRTASSGTEDIKSMVSGQLYSFGTYDAPSQAPDLLSFYYSSTDTSNNTTGYSAYRIARQTKNSDIIGSTTTKSTLMNDTNEGKDMYAYFGFLTYCSYGSFETTSFTSECAISSMSYSNKNFSCKVGDEYFTNLADAVEKCNLGLDQTLTFISDYICDDDSVTFKLRGTIDLNGHKILRAGWNSDPLFLLSGSNAKITIVSSNNPGSIEVRDGVAAIKMSGAGSITISENVTVKNTSTGNTSAAIALSGVGRLYNYGTLIGNRNGVYVKSGFVYSYGGTITSAYGVAINMTDAANYGTVYHKNNRAIIDGTILVGDLSKHNVFIERDANPLFDEGSEPAIHISGIINPLQDQTVVHDFANTTAEITIDAPVGYETIESGSDIILNEKVYTVTPRGDLFTLSGDLEFKYQEKDITFTVALKEAGTLRRIDVYCDVLTQLELETDYVCDLTTGEVTVYAAALKGDLSVRIARTAEHVITFVANGATGEVEPIIYTTGQTITFPDANSLTYNYHSFKEWNRKADGTGSHQYAGETADYLDEDITYYAIWTQSTEEKCCEFEALYLFIQKEGQPVIDMPIAITNNDFTGACMGEDGFYARAKAAFALLDETSRGNLMSTKGLSHFKAARARLLAWATANGDTYDSSSKLFVSSSSNITTIIGQDNLAIALIIGGISAFTLAGFVLIKKKKFN